MAGEGEAREVLASVPDAGRKGERDHEGDPEVVLDPDLMLMYAVCAAVIADFTCASTCGMLVGTVWQ
jgi:hypothetical protein